MVNLLPIFLGVPLTVLAIVLFRTYILFAVPKLPEPCADTPGHKPIALDDRLIERFATALKIRTITSDRGKYDVEALKKFNAFIKATYPNLHSSPYVTHEYVANYSSLYTIAGSDTSLRPYMLAAHPDVVPVEYDHWTVAPFDGLVKDGLIYGRGTVDMKDGLVGILEALEALFTNGWRPRRSLYVAFGHDEEGSGYDGAAEISRILQERGATKLLYLLDEGSFIVDRLFPGVDAKVALIGIAEKGYLSVKLTVNGEAGHASLAPHETTVLTLTKAVSKFKSTAHRNIFGTGPEKDLFEGLAPYAAHVYRIIYSNLWIFSPLVSLVLSFDPMGNALVRTTSAATIISGGVKDNVLPSTASAVINHRIHPMQTINDILEYDRKTIGDDRVQVEMKYGFDPSPISPFGRDSFGYSVVKDSVRKLFPDTVVVPGIMVASTDTKWYLNLTESIYRFKPVVFAAGEATMIHGHDERISLDNYGKLVNFYHHVILSSDEIKSPTERQEKDEL